MKTYAQIALGQRVARLGPHGVQIDPDAGVDHRQDGGAIITQRHKRAAVQRAINEPT